MDHWDPRFPSAPKSRRGIAHARHLELTKNSGTVLAAGRDRPSGADRVRTDDLRLARAALSQLSYSPEPLEQSARRDGGPR